MTKEKAIKRLNSYTERLAEDRLDYVDNERDNHDMLDIYLNDLGSTIREDRRKDILERMNFHKGLISKYQRIVL